MRFFYAFSRPCNLKIKRFFPSNRQISSLPVKGSVLVVTKMDLYSHTHLQRCSNFILKYYYLLISFSVLFLDHIAEHIITCCLRLHSTRLLSYFSIFKYILEINPKWSLYFPLKMCNRKWGIFLFIFYCLTFWWILCSCFLIDQILETLSYK